MPGLVHPKGAASGQGDLCHEPPTLVFYRRAGHTVCSHLPHEQLHVFTHQVQLVLPVVLARVDRHLCRGEREDQSPVANIHVVEAEHVGEKPPVGLSV